MIITTDGKRLDWMQIEATEGDAEQVLAIALAELRTRLQLPKHRVRGVADGSTVTIEARGNRLCHMQATANAVAVKLRQGYGRVDVEQRNPWLVQEVARLKGRHGGRFRIDPGSIE